MENKEVAKIDLKDLLPLGVMLVVLALVLGFGQQILGDTKDEFEDGSEEHTAINDSQDALGNVSEKLGTVTTIIMAAVVIGVVLRFFRV